MYKTISRRQFSNRRQNFQITGAKKVSGESNWFIQRGSHSISEGNFRRIDCKDIFLGWLVALDKTGSRICDDLPCSREWHRTFFHDQFEH